MSLELRMISAGYGGTTVLHDVDLTVEPGERVAVLGANGAGKSTLLSIIGGLLPPGRGKLSLDGKDISRLSQHRFPKVGIRWVGSPRPIYDEMSVNDNLAVGGFVARREIQRRRSEILSRFPELVKFCDVKAGGLSGGQSQILAIAQALMSRPKVLVLDEPSTGLAVSILERLGTIVESLAKDRVSVVWAEQFPDIALKYCDSVVIVTAGYVSAKIPVEEVDKTMLDEAYLGGSAN